MQKFPSWWFALQIGLNNPRQPPPPRPLWLFVAFYIRTFIMDYCADKSPWQGRRKEGTQPTVNNSKRDRMPRKIVALLRYNVTHLGLRRGHWLTGRRLSEFGTLLRVPTAQTHTHTYTFAHVHIVQVVLLVDGGWGSPSECDLSGKTWRFGQILRLEAMCMTTCVNKMKCEVVWSFDVIWKVTSFRSSVGSMLPTYDEHSSWEPFQICKSFFANPCVVIKSSSQLEQVCYKLISSLTFIMETSSRHVVA